MTPISARNFYLSESIIIRKESSMTLVPASFLVRLSYPCPYLKKIPNENKDSLLALPDSCRIDHLANLDNQRTFADVRLAWNEMGIGFQVEVKGKEQLPQGDAARARGSDGVTLWLDTRDSRASHRASRFCHQFHFLPTGGGENHDEPVFSQGKIPRALQDAPPCQPSAVPFRCERKKNGYLLEAFLPAAALNGFDPEQNRKLGFFYVIRDLELGEQVLGLGAEFPFWEDPTLWCVLDLVK
jgi:hypothetical protein